MPGATLEFSSLCLNNSLLLLNEAETKAKQKLSDGLGDAPVAANVQEKILVPAPPSSPMKADEAAQLRYVYHCPAETRCSIPLPS